MALPTAGIVVVHDATVHVTPSRTVRGDVVVTDGALSHVGPEPQPEPVGARVLRASGACVVPILINSAIEAQSADTRARHEVAPGNRAAFAVVRGAVNPARIGEMLIVDPRELVAVVLEDRLAAWDGEPAEHADADPTWVGAWRDARRDMTQFLTAQGRYSETRHGRENAYTGRFWAHRNLIAYLDDTGFWAFGQRVGDVLYHGGYVLRRT